MKYYHFIQAERAEKCFTHEVGFLRRLMEEDYQTYSNLETAFFDAFQELEGEELDAYFLEAEVFFQSVESYQEPANEEGMSSVVSRKRNSVMFSVAHAIAKACRLPADNYKATFGACLKLVRSYF